MKKPLQWESLTKVEVKYPVDSASHFHLNLACDEEESSSEYGRENHSEQLTEEVIVMLTNTQFMT